MRLNTLGGVRVVTDGNVVAGAAAQPRRLAVLALLARAGRTGVTREKILSLLWPDEPSTQRSNSGDRGIKTTAAGVTVPSGFEYVRPELHLCLSATSRINRSAAKRP